MEWTGRRYSAVDWQPARSMLLDNWPYKVAALVLALLLWFNVSAEQDRLEQAVRTRLEFEVQDTGWVTVDVPREVRTTFEGRRGEMLSLPFDQPVIRRTIEDVSGPTMEVRLDPSMVSYDRQLSIRPVAVRPQQVQLRFERLEAKRVPVTMDLRASAAQGYTIVGDPAMQPESVTVRGAASEVEAISHLETERVSLEGIRQTLTREVPVRVPDDLATVEAVPSQILVTLEVDTLVERTFSVPVRPRGPGAAGVVVNPPQVRVRVRGARRVLDGLTGGEVGAAVEVPGEVAGQSRLPVHVSLPEGVTATATPDPPLVLVEPERATEGAAEEGAAPPDTAGGGGW